MRFLLSTLLTVLFFSVAEYSFLAVANDFDIKVPEAGKQIKKFDIGKSKIYKKGWIDFNKNGVKDVYEDPEADIDARIDDLISQMTLDEKTCQMVTLYGYRRVLRDDLPTEQWKEQLWKDGIGAIDEHLNGFYGWGRPTGENDNCWPASRHAWALNQVQKFFVEHTRLGIPVDFTNEGIRGVEALQATNFPTQLGIGHTWNRDLVYQVGYITGREGRLLGYTNVYAPILDVGRDQRWGRYEEVYGESPYLVAELGVAMAQGLQKDHQVAATAKHFIAYSNNKGAREGMSRVDPQMGPHEVENVHVYPWREVIARGGLLGVMSSYNDYDGSPIQGSEYWLMERLRGDFGFKGYVVSDSDAVEYLHSKHRVAQNMKESVRQSVMAGLNVRCTFRSPDSYVLPLRELVKEGTIPMSVIDERVRDVLRVKFLVGLFDDPYQRDYESADREVNSAENNQVALEVSRQSIVLLKNAATESLTGCDSKALPLNLETVKKVAVIGPNADETSFATTHYGPCGVEVTSVLTGLRKRLAGIAEVNYEKGCELVDARWPESEIMPVEMNAEEIAMMNRAVELAKASDVAVLVLGGGVRTCGENKSRTSLELPGHQLKLAQAIKATGKPMIVVLINGRPLSINWVDKYADAIVEAWYPGSHGGTAIAEVLCGDYNPGAKLTVTFPRTVGQIPFNFPYKPASQVDGGSTLGLSGNISRVNGALYNFGYGLSYTEFKYDNLKLSKSRFLPDEKIELSFDLTNIGKRAGDEVVQLYIKDIVSSVTVYELQLRGFERVNLKPGETKNVKFVLDIQHDLSLLDKDMKRVVEPGEFDIIIAASSVDHKLVQRIAVLNPDGSIPDNMKYNVNTLSSLKFPFKYKKGEDLIFAVKEGEMVSEVLIKWSHVEPGSSFEISVTDGGGQFLPVYSGKTENGEHIYKFKSVKASELKISITSGLIFFEHIKCDAIK